MYSKIGCYFEKPKVKPSEKKAWEIVSLEREPEPGRTIDEYVECSAMYVAKRALIRVYNAMDESYARSNGQKNYSIVLIVDVEETPDGIKSPVIRWKCPKYSEVSGEIVIADVYGYAFAADVSYYYSEWYDALIEAIGDLLEFPKEQSEDGRYIWHIRIEEV